MSMKTHLEFDKGEVRATRPEDGRHGTLGVCGVQNEVRVYLGSEAGSVPGESVWDW